MRSTVDESPPPARVPPGLSEVADIAGVTCGVDARQKALRRTVLPDLVGPQPGLVTSPDLPSPGIVKDMKRFGMRQIAAFGLAFTIGTVAWEALTSTPASSPTHGPSPKLLFFDKFTGTSLDNSKWNPYVTSRAVNGRPWNDPQPHPMGDNVGVGCLYSASYYLASQVVVNDGLALTASRSSTSGWCNESASSSTFPWRSGAVSTYNHFQFDGGYVAITMKAPSGNGMWPALWMLPGPGGTHGDDSEIDLQEGGFAPPSPANETFAWHLHHGSTTWGGGINTGVDLTSGYHTYALDWIPGQSITWYLDGHEVAKLTSAQAIIPNEPMELIMDLAVANAKSLDWHTVYDSATRSPSVMQVSNVQVWSAPPG